SRLLYILLFGWASVTNAITAIKTPEVYLDYTRFALLPFYNNIINGFFSEHITVVVLTIAFSQLCIVILLFFEHKFLKFALLAGILFFIGIAPLGVGAALPSSLIWAMGLLLLFHKKLDVFKFKQVW
ncbi:MAG: hypothetical protein KJO64_06215, partial [Bacteroidia bacterium]|nr:hypothetical protein [Bacteroidia bacterium]